MQTKAETLLPSAPVTVIAEVGVNHNGELNLAGRLIEATAKAGADAVKFQTFRAAELVTRTAKKAGYQSAQTGSDESQFEMLKRLELSQDDHRTLKSKCDELRIEFLSTPFDLASAEFLTSDLDVSRLKVGSGELTNAPFLLAIARLGVPIILSTGMSDFTEIEQALRILAYGLTGAGGVPEIAAELDGNSLGHLRESVTLLHCTSEYPAPIEDVNLRVLPAMMERFSLPVGLSDHTPGHAAALGAVALGATVIEKHITLDKSLPGPDHAASLTPAEFSELVTNVRALEAALGSSDKQPQASELGNRDVARRSLVALRPIKQGELFDEENLGAKRPGSGLSPMLFWQLLGTKATRDFEADESILLDGVSEQ